MERHFTSTVFVVNLLKKAILLHWHEKVGAWLPPGGHIEKNEDPVQTAKREVLEETGLKIKILEKKDKNIFKEIVQVEPPHTILLEKIDDPKSGLHEHIDMIYFGINIENSDIPQNWQWVTKKQLEQSLPLLKYDGSKLPPPEDVKILGLEAINYVLKNHKNNVK
ncbi:MAG: hypothetical protein CL764_07365 [Chloroflexi bacterium]|nr:hypothetical protein [Chloroflexota bacterium]|tara:strand:+ start:35727 stop:36221 length:495 start_codon:yes stop_codon:yes gene_type:complete